MSAIEYFYSAHSVFAYIGPARFRDIAETAGRRIAHRPVNLGPVVSAAHPQGFSDRSKAHRAYYFGREIERWAEYRDVPMKGGVPASHYNDMTLANSILVAADAHDTNADGLAFAMMRAHWRDHADLADRGTLAALAGECGLDAEALFAAAATPEVADRLTQNTAEAIERSVFGSPTYVVDGDMFYGQDHLELVERALKYPFARTWD
jgi:2-hydroxychromene-2-carboxylate isomerase